MIIDNKKSENTLKDNISKESNLSILNYIDFKSRYLVYIYYNFINNTPQASLQCSPRGVTF